MTRGLAIIVFTFSMMATAFAGEFVFDEEKIERRLEQAGINVDLNGFSGEILTVNSNDKNPVKNYVVVLKDASGIPMYLAGLDKNSTVQLIDREKSITATHEIKSNKNVMRGKTISNVQFWPINELVKEGVILNVYGSKLTAALKVSIQAPSDIKINISDFSAQLQNDPSIVDLITVKAHVYYIKNVPFKYEGSAKKVDLELETANLNLNLKKEQSDIEHMHFIVGTFGISNVVFNDEALKALKEAQDK